jgi:hexokinase
MMEIGVALGKRSARLSAIGIVSLLKMTRLHDRPCAVGIDGTLFEQYPGFRSYLEEALKELLGHEAAKNVTIDLAKDGSGLGAAVIAALHHNIS